MPELSELLEQIKTLVDWNDETARAAAVEALKKSVNPLYMAINNLGFGAAQAKLEKQITDANTARDTAVTRAETAEAKVKEYENKTPEIATINQQWEAKVNDLKADHKKALVKSEARLHGVLVQRDQQALENLLVEGIEGKKVARGIAKVLARDPALVARMDYDDNGTLSVRQAGQQIPFAPGSGQTHLSLLAEEVLRSQSDDILISDGDAGGGVNGGGVPGSGDRAFYENLRKGVREGGNGDGAPAKSLRERMQGR